MLVTTLVTPKKPVKIIKMMMNDVVVTNILRENHKKVRFL